MKHGDKLFIILDDHILIGARNQKLQFARYTNLLDYFFQVIDETWSPKVFANQIANALEYENSNLEQVLARFKTGYEFDVRLACASFQLDVSFYRNGQSSMLVPVKLHPFDSIQWLQTILTKSDFLEIVIASEMDLRQFYLANS